MPTNKFTRDFSNFAGYPWPGKNMPEYYDWMEDAGDGNGGLQWMIHQAMSKYGPYHVIDDCVVNFNSTQATGSTGYAMWNGSIIEIDTAASGVLADGEYFMINSDGSYGTTGAKPTGVLIAKRVGSNMFDIRNREDVNSKKYIPNETYVYNKLYVKKNGIEASGSFNFTGTMDGTIVGDINLTLSMTGDIDIDGDITGHIAGGGISGFELVSAETGAFKEIKGFGADINMQNSIDLLDSSDIYGAVQITGTSGLFGDLHVSGLNLLPIGTILMYDGTSVAEATVRTGALGLHLSDGSDLKAEPMYGWFVCNGESGTPDLLDDVFIMGSGATGQAGGANTHTLTSDEMPSHTHSTSNPGNYHYHTYNKATNGGNLVTVAGGFEYRAYNYGILYNTSYAGAHTHTIASAGDDTAHNNMPSYYTVLYIKRIS